MRRLFILSLAEAPEEPVQGGEYHASPPVGLQAPVVSLVVVSLPEETEAEDVEEAGVVSIVLAGTTAGMAEDVMDGEEASGAAAAVVRGTAEC